MKANSAPARPRRDRGLWTLTKTAVRFGAELAAAFVFLVIAAETYAHHTFDSDPYYQLLTKTFAALVAWLGFLPLLAHLSPGAGKLAALAWVGFVALLVILRLVAGAPPRP